MLKRLRETPSSSSSSSSSAASGEERNHNHRVSRLTLEAWPPPTPILPPVPPAKDCNGGGEAGSGKSQEWDTRLLTHELKPPSKSENGVLLQNSNSNKDIRIVPSERMPSHRSSYEMPVKKAKKEAHFCHADLATHKAQNGKPCLPQAGRKDIDEEEEDEEDGKEAEASDGRILSSLVLVDVDVGGQTVRSKGKDRHSKVRTAKGLRDRRVRLSAPTAIQFFDVQDRLGFDQPSKAVDWLLRTAKPAIEELQQLKEAGIESTQETNKSKEEEEKEEMKNVSASSSPFSARITTPGPALKAEKESALESPASSSSLKRTRGPKSNSPVHDKNRAGLRAKAREKARERANLVKGKDSFLLIPAANEGIKEGDSRDDNDHCSILNEPSQAEQQQVADQQEQQQQPHCAYTFPQSHQQSGNERSASNSTPVTSSELSHHLLLLKQQQALQASLLSYLLSNVPCDAANTAQRQFPPMHPAAAPSSTEAENASRLHAPSPSSSSSQQQPPWQEQVMYEDTPGFHQRNSNMYCPGGAGVQHQPLSTTNSIHASAYSKSREDRAAAALVYSHLLMGHYQLDSQISSQQVYQAPAAFRPPPPSMMMNESMNRHGFYNHHNPHHHHHQQQQPLLPQPPLPTQAAWVNQNYQQSSTGGTLQSIFSPTSNSLLLLAATGEHATTPPSSSSTASANLLNINIASRSIPAWSTPDHLDGPPPPTSSWSHH